MKGYQFLQNDFFELCRTRKISRIPMLLYIYLRGLYCRFQKPTFYWYDKTTRDHLGISVNTLSAAKKHLQERGLIEYKSGTGRIPTHYTMLGAAILPELRVSKIDTLRINARAYEGIKNQHPISPIKERDKKIDIFQGMTDKDRAILKEKGIL